MGFEQGHFAFDSPNLTYYTGQIVHGKLVFDQEKFKTFRGLYVRVKGYCNVHWTSSRTRRVDDRTEHYTVDHNSHETYFENKIYLMGGLDGEVHLSPGHHEFPFECQIPIQCPSSYEGPHGHIRYEVRAVVDRCMKFDQEKLANITVIANKDLNATPQAKEPMVFNFKESYCCWCMSVGSCEIIARAPQSGYCPGQTINIELDVANRSNVEIDTIKFDIKEKTHFRAVSESGSKDVEKTIAALMKGPVAPNTTRNWALEMEIPQMSFFNLDTCQYIDIDYEFKVEITTSGCHEDTSASKRIIIGNIPLRDADDKPVPLAEYPTNPIQPQINQPTQAMPGSPYQPNPSFQPNPIFPGGIPSYPPNQQFPASPYPAMPFPNPTSPYPNPTTSPYSNPTTSPYPSPNPPYPNAAVAPYPTVAPYSENSAKAPLLPPATSIPYPINPPIVNSPFAQASAPEPGTPDTDAQKEPIIPLTPAYNPEESASIAA